ncbi:ergothioneine biosynthesis protein EgtC [Kribbella sp. NPDC051770]|uniref:ergothioneine biosynthesis protein EgtC n=1 Tax=Kribbella sp. NPDC051770 TaxID=3155413 RepID=UPI003429EE3C
MCRHLAYLGPSVSLASLVLDPPHSLYKQSWAPKDMRGGGSVNADGFGLGWYLENEAVRYRRSVPIWADENLPGLTRSISSGAVIAAVRNGTTGMPLGEGAAAPFQHDQWFFSHNGLIRDWPGSVAKLAEGLPVTDLLTLDAPVDSALLWALIVDRLDRGPAEAVASVVQDVEAAAPGSRLNILLTDGEQLVATTWTHALWVRQTDDSVTVSSEPWTDDPGWRELPDRTLLTATRYACSTTSMEGRQ